MNGQFYLNEEGRQHISLSTHAMATIELDMVRFNDDYELKNRSGFINTIITNYYDKFPLSRDVALKQINAIKKAIKSDDFSTKLTEKIIETFSNEIMKKSIEEYAQKYTSEVQFKVKVNKENIETLKSLEDAKYFNAYAPRSGISFYIKMILETYASQTREIRERIYFKETIDEIENAHNNHTFVKYYENNQYIKAVPSSVYKHKSKQSVEVVLVTEDKTIRIKKVKDLKKSKIRALKEKHGLGKNIANEIKDGIGKLNSQPREQEEFVIKFTDAGLQRFIYEEDNLSIIGIPNQNNENLYTFKATETDIFFNLFKYGLQAEIIMPLRTRENFKKLYKASYDHYQKPTV